MLDSRFGCFDDVIVLADDDQIEAHAVHRTCRLSRSRKEGGLRKKLSSTRNRPAFSEPSYQKAEVQIQRTPL